MIKRLENQLSVLRQLKEKTWKKQDNDVKQMSQQGIHNKVKLVSKKGREIRTESWVK